MRNNQNIDRHFEQIAVFRKTFNQPIRVIPSLYNIPEDEFYLHLSMLTEEIEEMSQAFDSKNLLEFTDGIIDTQYVLFQIFMLTGMYPLFSDLFNEVHRSNMSKVGADGNPIFRNDGKVLKGANFTPPNFCTILTNYIADNKKVLSEYLSLSDTDHGNSQW
jgi:predicted HAD superfamily Cof-like phosphohydrolase